MSSGGQIVVGAAACDPGGACRRCREHPNDLLLQLPEGPPKRLAVFFPGDAQDLREPMAAGPHAALAGYALERTAAALAEQPALRGAAVLCVRAAELQDATLARYLNFVPAQTLGGSVPRFPAAGTACAHLLGLLACAQARSGVPLDALPVTLIGFSRGGVVLTQLVAELAAGGLPALRALPAALQLPPPAVAVAEAPAVAGSASASPDEGARRKLAAGAVGSPRAAASPSSDKRVAVAVAGGPAQDLFGRVQAVHWVDAGNGPMRGALPGDAAALRQLAAVRPDVALRVHASPYQLAGELWPWVPEEIDAFVALAQSCGLAADAQQYFDGMEPSIEQHFAMLDVVSYES